MIAASGHIRQVQLWTLQ